MKLKLWQTVLLIGICVGTLGFNQYMAEAGTLSNSDFLRFHVVANSDTEEDQKLKLAVRDGIIEAINLGLTREVMAQPLEEELSEGESTKVTVDQEDAKRYVSDNMDEIVAVAERIIEENGYGYKVAAKLGVRWIPEKTYKNVTFPAGNYEAFTVTIGKGEGENWWCVLFPPLCLIGAEAPDSLDEKYAPLTEAKGETTLKLKFKTAEFLEKH